MPSEPARVEMRNNRPLKHMLIITVILNGCEYIDPFSRTTLFLPGVIMFVKVICPFLSLLRADRAIEAVVIHVFDPHAGCEGDKGQR